MQLLRWSRHQVHDQINVVYDDDSDADVTSGDFNTEDDDSDADVTSGDFDTEDDDSDADVTSGDFDTEDKDPEPVEFRESCSCSDGARIRSPQSQHLYYHRSIGSGESAMTKGTLFGSPVLTILWGFLAVRVSSSARMRRQQLASIKCKMV